MSPLSPTSWWHVPLFVRFQDTINNQQSQCLTWYNLATKRKLFWRPSVIKRLPCFAVVTTDTNWNAMSTTIVQDCDMKITEHFSVPMQWCILLWTSAEQSLHMWANFASLSTFFKKRNNQGTKILLMNVSNVWECFEGKYFWDKRQRHDEFIQNHFEVQLS